MLFIVSKVTVRAHHDPHATLDVGVSRVDGTKCVALLAVRGRWLATTRTRACADDASRPSAS
jgi:hypothetical protein